jgi:hypothetical protein
MNKALGLANQLAGFARKAEKQLLVAIGNEQVPDEPAITNQFLGAMRAIINGKVKKGIQWSSYVLSSIGPNAEESKFGADFMGILDINVQDFVVKKGFLAQAKRMTKGLSQQGEWDRLRQQCDLMLSYTPDSYVFVYGADGFLVIPAISCLSLTKPKIETLYSNKLDRFYKDHVTSFVGDRKLSGADKQTLKALSTDIGIPALVVEARGELVV